MFKDVNITTKSRTLSRTNDCLETMETVSKMQWLYLHDGDGGLIRAREHHVLLNFDISEHMIYQYFNNEGRNNFLDSICYRPAKIYLLIGT